MTSKNKITAYEVPYGANKKAWWKCSTCGHEWEARIDSRCNSTNPIGCPKCRKKNNLKVYDELKSINDSGRKSAKPKSAKPKSAKPKSAKPIKCNRRVEKKDLKVYNDEFIRGIWDSEELQFLIDNYPTRGRKFCSSYLNRRESSVQKQINKLSLKREFSKK
jgi:DNA-directed RNA polymerase subunit RPC12/RpoP